MHPNIKTKEEIEAMRIGGQILAETLDLITTIAKEGMSTFELDKIAEEFILEKNAIPAFKGFQGFPATLCTSINNIIVHGIPKKSEILKNGDLLKIDCGVIFKNLYTDAARAIGIGDISNQRKRLIKVSKEALERGISEARPNAKVSNISKAIEDFVKKNGFKIIYDLTGHGVGKKLHETPTIFNYYNKQEDCKLEAGMTIAIEPIFSVSTHKLKTEKDNWSLATTDGSDSVQYEDTILITETGSEILTRLK
jgi:methionyl aminopeptidase